MSAAARRVPAGGAAAVALLLAAAAVGCSAPGGSAPGHLLVVSAGAHDRINTPVALELPSGVDASGPLHLVGADGEQLPLQLDQDRRAHFILPELPAGAEAHFTIQSGDVSPPGVEAQRQGESVTLSVDGRAVLTYHGAPTPLPRADIDPVYSRGGYIHPVRTPDGVVVTGDYPPDHVHHHGIWAAWTRARYRGEQVDFWNVADRLGDVLAEGVDSAWSGPVFGGFSAEHRYVSLVSGEAEEALREQWVGRVYNVTGGERPYWLFELEVEQRTAGAEPLYLPTYHYGGVALRGRDDWFGVANADFLTSEGHDRLAGNETQARWVHLGGAAEGQRRGIAVLSHPDNFRHPEPVRLHPNEPYFSWTPSQLGDWSIQPGSTHRVRYRYLVHDGSVDPEELERVWNDFADPPSLHLQVD